MKNETLFHVEHAKMETLNNCPACDSEAFSKFKDCKDFTFSGEVFSIQVCSNCGLKFTNPRPLPENIGHYYESKEYISHTNSTQGLFNKAYQTVRKYTLGKKLELINSVSEIGNLLDYGCGTGEFLNTCQSGGWNVFGVEPGDKARETAIGAYNLSIKPSFNPEDFVGTKFNVITLWHVLEHVPDLHTLLENLKKVLTKDGIIIIAVPNPNSLDAEFYGKFWAAYDLPRHLHHFSPDSLKFLLEKHGMNIQKILPMNFDSFYVSLLSEKYLAADQKKQTSNFIRAIFTGFKSNLHAWRNPGTCSSQIYLISSN